MANDKPSKWKMAAESVADSIKSLPRRTITVVKDALTPTPTVNAIEDYKTRQKKEIDTAFDETSPGKKKGGRVTARGVGKALRGHGKAMK